MLTKRGTANDSKTNMKHAMASASDSFFGSLKLILICSFQISLHICLVHGHLCHIYKPTSSSTSSDPHPSLAIQGQWMVPSKASSMSQQCQQPSRPPQSRSACNCSKTCCTSWVGMYMMMQCQHAGGCHS